MGIRDNDIERARQRMYIPVWQFQGYVEATDTLGSAGGGAAVPQELAGIRMSSLTMVEDDEIAHVMEFPSFWDITEEIGVRVRWVAVGHNATTDAIRWGFSYGTFPDGTVLATPATALDTILVDQTIGSTTTLTHKRTARGIINRNTFAESNLDGMFGFEIVASSVTTFTGAELRLLGVSFDYMPVYSVGGQNALSTSRD